MSASQPSQSGGLHARQGSIKRTPSDLSRDLAAANLPPPSAITKAEQQSKSSNQEESVRKELSEAELDEPEG